MSNLQSKVSKKVLKVCRQLRDHIWILRVLALRPLSLWMVRAPVLAQPTVQALQGNLKDVTLIGETDSKMFSKVIHNMFYSTMGVVQFTVWEAIFLHCYATNRLPYLSDEQVFNLLRF